MLQKYVGKIAVNLAACPMGDWTGYFQAIGYSANGVANEFPWMGLKIVEFDRETGQEVYSGANKTVCHLPKIMGTGSTRDFDAWHCAFYAAILRFPNCSSDLGTKADSEPRVFQSVDSALLEPH